MKDISLAAKAFRFAQKARFSQCMGQSDPNALYLTLERTRKCIESKQHT
jgi:hypothetical protein